MTLSRSLEHSIRLGRDALSPSAEQAARVRAALSERMPTAEAAPDDGRLQPRVHSALHDTVSRETGSGDTVLRDTVLRDTVLLQRNVLPGSVKSVALLAVGFALGYSVAQGRPSGAPAAVPEGAASAVEVTTVASSSSSPSPVEAPGATHVDHDRTAIVGPAEPVPDEHSRTAPWVSGGSANGERGRARGAEAPASRGHTPAAAHTQPPRAKRDDFAAELALLQRAERAIRSGEGVLARSFLRELEARFPHTMWRQERQALSLLAGCLLAEPDAAGRAREFLARHSDSVYVDRIQALCSTGHGESLGSAPGSR